MNADPHRNQAGSSWQRKAIAYALAATFAGALMGVTLGFAGSTIPVSVRTAIGTVVAIAAIGVGGAEIIGLTIPMPQLDRETPQR